MTPGDIPCNADCHNRLCFYELYGQCTDNAPCERQISEIFFEVACAQETKVLHSRHMVRKG